MTGYCRLCGLRIEGPAGPLDLSQTPEQRGRDELVGLGLLTLHHLSTEHLGQLAGVFSLIASLEALIACYCLKSDGIGPPATEASAVVAFRLEAVRERLKHEVVAWLAKSDPVEFSPAVQRRSSNPPNSMLGPVSD